VKSIVLSAAFIFLSATLLPAQEGSAVRLSLQQCVQTAVERKPIIIPDDILNKHLTKEEVTKYKANPAVIRSITVYVEKKGCCCTSC